MLRDLARSQWLRDALAAAVRDVERLTGPLSPLDLPGEAPGWMREALARRAESG